MVYPTSYSGTGGHLPVQILHPIHWNTAIHGGPKSEQMVSNQFPGNSELHAFIVLSFGIPSQDKAEKTAG